MGFKLKRTYLLTWEDGDMAGCEVRMKSTSLGQRLAVGNAESNEEVNTIFLKHVQSWNLLDPREEEDVPLPMTLEGVQALEEVVISEIIHAWLDATMGRTAPLDLGSKGKVASSIESSGGAPSVDLSTLPVESL